jgi:N-acetylmuramic acid 6-phosphate etherase
MVVHSKWQQLPTEAINPASLGIDKLSPAGIIELMLDEDRKMVAAVAREKERIACGVDIISQALKKGGRLVFIGAGTSGRLGSLEAAEIPPTFGAAPNLVRAIMAGGRRALVRARVALPRGHRRRPLAGSGTKPPRRCSAFEHPIARGSHSCGTSSHGQGCTGDAAASSLGSDGRPAF